MIEVAGGVIVRDNRILLAQRPASKDFPLTWECPGGKVESHESHHMAIRRELFEELGIAIGAIVEHATWCGKFENPVSREDRASILLLFYRVLDFYGEPRSREGQGFGWFTEAEMRALTLTPGNARALEDIVRHAFPKAKTLR